LNNEDIEGPMLNLGCGRLKFGDVRMDFMATPGANIVGDALHLPFKGDVFAKVYERNLLEHLPNTAAHLSEVKRVMKKGGLLTLITDNAACLKFYLLGTHTGAPAKRSLEDRHYALFTPEHLRNLAHWAGLEVQKLQLIDTEYYSRFFDVLVRSFAPVLSYAKILMEARRK
jgi:ubiquinone/menaquinone biosynthesis C-methylase UbiE